MAKKRTTKTSVNPPKTQPPSDPTKAHAKPCDVKGCREDMQTYLEIFGKRICMKHFHEAAGDLEKIKEMLNVTAKKAEDGGEDGQG